MLYVYLLQSEKDQGFYIGFTDDPEQRFRRHQNGDVESTKYRRPLRLIYIEGYTDEHLARERERKLKMYGSAYKGLLKRLGFE